MHFKIALLLVSIALFSVSCSWTDRPKIRQDQFISSIENMAKRGDSAAIAELIAPADVPSELRTIQANVLLFAFSRSEIVHKIKHTAGSWNPKPEVMTLNGKKLRFAVTPDLVVEYTTRTGPLSTASDETGTGNLVLPIILSGGAYRIVGYRFEPDMIGK